jgi:long-subunit acyl-CoA synthetase (AMP-forming)
MEVMFTSGTTGRPKGVMNSANTKLSGLRGFLSTIDARLDDVWGVLAPMAHNAGWLYSTSW